MYCPEHLIFNLKDKIYLWMYWRDVPRKSIPLSVWLNPLRYELFIRIHGKVFVINREGRAGYIFSRKVAAIKGYFKDSQK